MDKDKCICGVDANKPHSLLSNGGVHGIKKPATQSQDDLNNKLREILLEHSRVDYLRSEENGDDFEIDDFIAQIHQAYKEAGYIHVNLGQETQAALANTMLGHKVMTGQDWEQKALKAGWTKPDDRN